MSPPPDEAEPLLSSSSSTLTANATSFPASKSSIRTQIHTFSCFLSAFSAGWHDGCIGALIPFFKIYFPSIADSTLSLIFLAGFFGYVVACLCNITLTGFFGLEGVLGFGAGVQTFGSVVISLSVFEILDFTGNGGFGVVVLGFVITGFGIAVQDAAYNTYAARLDGKEGKLGVVHAVYGVGALISPVFVLMFSKGRFGEAPPVWFLGNAGWCLIVIFMLFMEFILDRFSFSSSRSGVEIEDVGEEEGSEEDEDVGKNGEMIVGLKMVIRHKMVWTTLVFICLYTGSELTESSWIITFLLRERIESPLSHYASTAFYTGLTSSRILLLPITKHLTPRIAISAYIFLALISQILIWTFENVKVDIAAIAATGFVMGPIYPVTVGLLTGGVKREFQTGAMSALCLTANAGSAGFPFLVGVLADKFGLKALPGVMVGLFLSMGLAWGFVPLGKDALVEGVFGIGDVEECV